MKKTILIIATACMSLSAFATTKATKAVKPTTAAQKAIDNLKNTEIRTVVIEVKNTEGNPCLPEGTSYEAVMQVRKARYDYNKKAVIYDWEIIKSVNVDKDGGVMELCLE